jgi:hypothetical protein
LTPILTQEPLMYHFIKRFIVKWTSNINFTTIKFIANVLIPRNPRASAIAKNSPQEHRIESCEGYEDMTDAM